MRTTIVENSRKRFWRSGASCEESCWADEEMALYMRACRVDDRHMYSYPIRCSASRSLFRNYSSLIDWAYKAASAHFRFYCLGIRFPVQKSVNTRKEGGTKSLVEKLSRFGRMVSLRVTR